MVSGHPDEYLHDLISVGNLRPVLFVQIMSDISKQDCIDVFSMLSCIATSRLVHNGR